MNTYFCVTSSFLMRKNDYLLLKGMNHAKTEHAKDKKQIGKLAKSANLCNYLRFRSAFSGSFLFKN